MLKKTQGIVLQSIKYSETSIICRIFTRDFGLQSYLVKGVRTAKPSAKGPLFRPLNVLDLIVYRKESKNLQHLKEYKVAYLYQALPFDIVKSSIALFMIEVLSKVLKEEEVDEELYAFANHSLVSLDVLEHVDPNFHLYFLLELSKYLGFIPSGDFAPPYEFFDLREGNFVMGPAIHGYQVGLPYSQYIAILVNGESTLSISSKERNIILDYLLQYYAFHLPDFGGIKSHKILHEVLGK
ncbi:MAG: DNA repair protein RecO [Chitinophagales bacterium]|nr:DNA repair protein RecO [Chitinophagales bacterium]